MGLGVLLALAGRQADGPIGIRTALLTVAGRTTYTNEGVGHSPSMARNATPAASVLPGVVPDASFVWRDPAISVTLTIHECSIVRQSVPYHVTSLYIQGRQGAHFFELWGNNSDFIDHLPTYSFIRGHNLYIVALC